MTLVEPAQIGASPATPPPVGACDSHTHVFGDPSAFAYAAALSYAPPAAPRERHAQMRGVVGVDRAVLVQPAPYGQDHSAMLDAIAASGGRLRGVGVAAAGTADAVLARMAEGGIRALRFVEQRLPDGGRYAGSIGLDHFRDLAPRMQAHGLHLELWAGLPAILEALPALEASGLPIVLDHMAGFDPDAGVDDPRFQTVLGLLRDGRVTVKLTLARRSPDRPAFTALRPFHEAMVAANPAQLVWGSDWPFVRMDNPPSPGGLLDLFADWTPDAVARQAVLVDNPARLYGFGVPA